MTCSQATLWTLLVSAILFAGATEAATVTDLQGEVLVNRGTGYAQVKEPQDLVPGDRVMVGSGSSARISFSKSCVIPIRPGDVVTVGAEPPCASKGSHVATNATQQDQVPTPPEGLDPGTLIVGKVVVIGGTGLAFGVSWKHRKDEKPASP